MAESRIRTVKAGDTIQTTESEYGHTGAPHKKSVRRRVNWTVTEICPYCVVGERMVNGQTFHESFDYGWLVANGYEQAPEAPPPPECDGRKVGAGPHHNAKRGKQTPEKKTPFQDRYAKRRAAGRCGCCGRINNSGYATCDICREKHRIRDAALRERRKKAALEARKSRNPDGLKEGAES